MATAARRTANYNTLYSTIAERWYNRDKAEEIIFKNNPILQIVSQRKEVDEWGADITVRLADSRNTTVDSYQYYDTLDTTAMRGPVAARFTLANYNAAITISDQEMRENRGPSKIADRIGFHIDQAELSMAERLNTDIYKGNVAKSTNLLGLEQAIAADVHVGNAGGNLTARWQIRQTDSAYGGITRSAFTSATAGGTGWENCAIDMTGASGNTTTADTFAYSGTAPYPENKALVSLREGYDFASYGTIHPDLMVSSYRPFADYEAAAATKMQIQKESSVFGDVQLRFRNMKYGNAIWIMDEDAVTQNASSAIGAETNGEDNVYLLNTMFMRFLVDSGMDFELGPPRTPIDQHAFVRHMAFSGQLIITNPRYFCRLFGYGGTGA